MQQSPLQCARSRRPLSVDDVQVAEAFLLRTSLDDVYESPGDDSGVFLPSPLSSSSSFSFDERNRKSTPDIPVTLKRPTPNAHRWLHSCTEGTLITFTLYVSYVSTCQIRFSVNLPKGSLNCSCSEINWTIIIIIIIIIIYSLILRKLTKIWSNAHYNYEKLRELKIHI